MASILTKYKFLDYSCFFIRKNNFFFICIKGLLGFIIIRMTMGFILEEKNILLIKIRDFKNLLILIDWAIKGVMIGFFVELKVLGLGFKYALRQNHFLLDFGKSHSTWLKYPADILVIARKKRLIFFGINSINFFSFLKNFINIKPPTSYKLRGILYKNRVYKLKIGKKK